MRVHVIIPFKGIAESKSRLANEISEELRKRLVTAMLTDVISAVTSSKKVNHLIIVTSDRNIENLVPKNATLLLENKPRGINQAIIEATEYSINMRAEATLVIPADLPLIKPLDINTIILEGRKKPSVILSSSITEGTNILYRCPPKVIEPKFGKNSFQAHLDESRKMNIEPKIYSSPRVSLDLDEIEDLKKFIQYGNNTETFRVLQETELTCLKQKKQK
ncbi:MAG: 2-phospho-L-lactate guanylyltransferase [Candidatus Jordarchaeaceae archaeon]